MAEDTPRWPQGDKMYPSQIQLKEQGWVRGDPPTKVCQYCGALCEWWEAPDKSGWKLFNRHTIQRHSETCSP
jgi:hypothetical protein